MTTEVALEGLGIAVAARIPILLWGAPGTGKTSAIRALADQLEWPCETVIAAIREPSDFAGLPVISDGDVRFAPPKWASRLAAAGEGILFLDEISTAPPAVQAALLRVVLEKTVGDLTLPDGISIIAAANPPEQSADGWDLSAPLANRFCHLDWTVNPRTFAEGIAAGFESAVVPVLPTDWEASLPLALGLVSGFINVRPSLACEVPDEAGASGRAWPSPRTWEMAARLWTAAALSGSSEDARAALIMGSVGEGAGVEFLSWVYEMDLPDPNQLLEDPAAFVVLDRDDRTFAVLSAVVSAVLHEPTLARWEAGWIILAEAGRQAPDVAATAARMLARFRPQGASLPKELETFGPILKAAGLLQ